MNECSKAIQRRLSDSRFIRRYFVGRGLDIGAGDDGLSKYGEFFPLMGTVRDWDVADGDAQYLAGVPDQALDFVHSSHCLEHMYHPGIALENWLRVLKPGGHLICIVPDEDLYEQGVFPSRWNGDHKFTFTIHKAVSWSTRSISLTKLIENHGKGTRVLKMELLDSTFRFNSPVLDQTLGTLTESAIEFILRKQADDGAAS
jgi:SAM-dependent methyltransferase